MIKITCGKIAVTALVDTGSTTSVITESILNEIQSSGLKIEILPVPRSYIVGVNKKRSSPITKQVFFCINIGDKSYDLLCLVVKQLLYPVIIGNDFLNQNKAVIDYQRNKLILQDKDVCELGKEEEEIFNWKTCCARQVGLETQIHEQVMMNSILNEGQKQSLIQLLLKYRQVFEQAEGPVNTYKFHIDVVDDTPFVSKSFPIAQTDKNEVNKLIQSMVAEGIIEKRNTPYINPIVMVKKKNGKIRLCLDARKINHVTIPLRDRPMKLQEVTDRLSGIKWLSSTDFTASYWQIAIDKNSQKYTGFLYNGISYVFLRMPFGMKNSAAALVQCLDNIIGSEMKENVFVYIDDILAFDITFEEHLNSLEKLFKLLLKNNLRLNFDKSKFATQQVKFMGYNLTTEGLKMNFEKLYEIEKIKPPRNCKQLKSFLGCVQYYSKFVYNYAVKIDIFLQLLKKGVKWEWTERHDKAFNDLKAAFYESCTLSFPDFDKEFVLQTDCSETGMGAILYQVIGGQEKIIMLISRVLRGPETRYTVTEKELHAIVWSVYKLREYLTGRSFILKTDHKALIFLKRTHFKNDRLARWAIWLQQFSFTVVHCAGQENWLPDFLSRNYSNSNAVRSFNDIPVSALDLEIKQIPDLNWNRVADLQDAEPEIYKVKQFLNNELTEEDEDVRKWRQDAAKWKLVNNAILCRVKCNPDVYRIWIPTVLRVDIIWLVHTDLGHFGAEKVNRAISDVGYWKGRKEQVRRVIATCLVCQKTKYPNRSFAGIPHAIIPESPNTLVAIDLYGPLPKAKFGNQFIFVCIDVFSKYIQLYPINKANSHNCAIQLRKFFELAGNYVSVLSDRGSQFTSDPWKREMQQMKVKHYWTSVRHPQSNPVERCMKEISRLCRVYVHRQHTLWYLLIPHINRWLNSIFHESIMMTPQEAHFGTKPVHPLQQLINREITTVVASQDDVRNNLEIAAQKRRKQASKNPYEFQINEKVLVRIPRQSDPLKKEYGKFHRLYEGPYRISEVKEPNVAVIVDDDNVVVGQFNFFSLKPCVD